MPSITEFLDVPKTETISQNSGINMMKTKSKLKCDLNDKIVNANFELDFFIGIFY